ncbi:MULTISPECIES: TcfC E-set like domain-containing protein [unclassified Providencia]|uniref:TcfC E-set like domain-containing protein n=1 Tax=unclassified Providencia TaxID=2633465 RepID=UPI00234BD216|nr:MULTISPECIES: TcfC E-set like domain-containing protein [unclassified Providencia]WOC00432.1 TcfC E-set like domain-containing protein [Providencia sp. PROV046]
MHKNIIALSMMSFIFSNVVYAKDIKRIKVGGCIISPAFVMALEEGMSVPVFLRLNTSREKNQSEDKIADAIIIVEQGKIKLANINFIDNSQGPKLSSLLIDELENSKDNFFNESNNIKIDKDALLQLDISSFNLSLDVDQDAFVPKEKVRQFSLGDSSVNDFSSVANYDLGVFGSQVKKGKNSSSSYFNLDTLLAIAEHHININASAYSIGKSNSDIELYRVMYERDFNGIRYAIGLMSTWNLQSIASLTTLNSSKIYAVTLGNNASSVVVNSKYSLTPIYVFLNSPGEIRIYRDGKLLNIQNFPMGSFEVDTSILPFGIYDVTIETVVDGKIVTTQHQTINKSFGTSGANFEKLNWEVYGGYVDFDKKRYVRGKYSKREPLKQSYLVGASVAKGFPVLSGLNIQMSNYGYDNFLINESSINFSLNQYVSLSWQGMIENHGSHRNIATLSTNIPDGYGSVWASKEKAVVKGELPIYDSDSYSYGATLNFDKVFERAGTFTISSTKDKRIGSDSINYEYSNTLFSGRYGTIGLRTGVQRYHYDDQKSMNEKFISLDFSLPLSTWLSTGVSSSNGNVKANIFANVLLTLKVNSTLIPFTPAAASIKIGPDDGSNVWRNYNSAYAANSYFKSSNNYVSIFFSNTFFKQLVTNNIDFTNSQDFFTFSFTNPAAAPQSGYYEFTPSNQLVIKPRDYSISIVPADYIPNPSKTGKIGPAEPPIEFNYIVTTSGPRQADAITARVEGPTVNVNGQNFCLFSSDDDKFRVPFSAYLSFKNASGIEESYRSNCDGTEISMNNALWAETPWDIPNQDLGSFYRTNLDLRFPMNDSNSLFTLDGIDWLGTVSASGTVVVKAIWTGPDVHL